MALVLSDHEKSDKNTTITQKKAEIYSQPKNTPKAWLSRVQASNVLQKVERIYKSQKTFYVEWNNKHN